MDKLYIFGAGGAGSEIAWLSSQVGLPKDRLVFLVDHPQYLQGDMDGVPVKLVSDVTAADGSEYVVSVGNPLLRSSSSAKLDSMGFRAAMLVHPRAELAHSSSLGEGTLVCAGVVIAVNVRIGKHVYINIGSTISHDVVIGDFCTICPGATLCGHVQLGRGVFVGAGTTIINGSARHPIRIGDGAIIAAGACVTGSVEPNTTVGGVPASRLK